MSPVSLTALGAVLAFVLVPVAARNRLPGRGSARLAAALHLVVLLGWAVLPVAALACLGQGFGATVAHLAGEETARSQAACPTGPLTTPWQLAGLGLGVLGVVPLARQGWTTLRSARRLERDLADCPPGSFHKVASRAGREVLVVESDERVALAGGLAHPKALVSTGLLAGLGEQERRAVIEHEAAHLRLGHPRALLLGGIVAGAWGALPPVRIAWSRLRAELEAAADDEAAAVVGPAALRSALARVGLATLGASAAGFGDPEHLRWRIRRLEAREARAPLSVSATLLAGLGGLVVALAWSSCALVSGTAALGGLAGCGAVVAAVATRPLWTTRTRHLPPRRLEA